MYADSSMKIRLYTVFQEEKCLVYLVTLFLWPWDQKIGYMLLAMPLFSSFSRHSLASPPWKSPPWLFLALIFRDCAAPLPPARCYLAFCSMNKKWFYLHTRRCPIATTYVYVHIVVITVQYIRQRDHLIGAKTRSLTQNCLNPSVMYQEGLIDWWRKNLMWWIELFTLLNSIE